MGSSKKNILLLSGTVASEGLEAGEEAVALGFAADWIKDLFSQADGKPILFVPYARTEGMSEEAYFKIAQSWLARLGINAVCASPDGLTEKDFKGIGGIFVGGGHTYTLLHKLQKNGAVDLIRKHVNDGLPYLGSSAGTIIACPTIKTTNDMPCGAHDVIDVRSLGLIGAQLNCHYRDQEIQKKKDPDHNGESNDERLREFCAFNENKYVLGLPEGHALRVLGDRTLLLASKNARGVDPSLFINDQCTKLKCKIGEPLDVSDIFRVQKLAVQPRHQHQGPRR